MGFDERLGWFLLGIAAGFIAGYIVRALRELNGKVDHVQEELHEVDTIVKTRLQGEDGFMSNRLVADLLMIVVLCIVVWSALASQKATNDSHKVTVCSQQFLNRTIKALNERTTYTQAQAESNVALQKDQQAFFSLLLRRPPEPEARRSAAAQDYLKSLNGFVEISQKNVSNLKQNPYPTNQELQECLD